MRCRDDLVQDLKTIIYFLADKGIGSGISSGKGHFKSVTIVDDVPYHEPQADDSTHVVTLSLTYPDDELKQLLSRSWYALERRQGKIESMYAPVKARKDSLLMLREGSTFPKNGRQQYGMNAIVRKAGDGLDFDVWQYGFAFTVNTQHIIPS
jgi:CRISPR type III-A-associated RAMP protein Csm4